MRGQPTDEDLRKVREFQDVLQLPTKQERVLAEIKAMPPSTDLADCICGALKQCLGADGPCPYCRTLEVHLPCPKLGFGCGIFMNDCGCCTAWQRHNAREGRRK